MNHNRLTKWCVILLTCLFAGVFYTSSAQTRVTSRIAASSDDAEQRGSNATNPGEMYLNSSDLELVRDGSARGNQLVGLVFRNLNIPQGATITSAYIQFTTDETNSGTTNLTIRGENSNNAGAFTNGSNNISSRPLTSAVVAWNSVAAWNTVGQAGSSQRTPDLAGIIQEIVNRGGWQPGNAMAMIISGTGERTAESFDGSSANAPLLVVNYTQNQVRSRISGGADDAEQHGNNATTNPGEMYLNSSDLELVQDGSARGNQLVGLVFRNLGVPQGATITSAYIQFTTDEASSGTTNLSIRGEDRNNASAFTSSNNNISSRPLTSATVAWNSVGAWNTVGQAGSNQRTPDLKNIVQEIVNRNGWQSGNAVAMIISGTGKRTAESFEGSPSDAPLLVINYTSGSTGNNCAATVQNFPYTESFESGIGSWKQASNDDLNWVRNSGGTPSSSTGPSSADAGTYYLYVESSGNGTGYPNKVATLNSPCFDVRSIDNPRFTFRYHMYGSSMGTLVLQASTNGSNWTTVWSESGNQGNSWNSATINLNSYTNNATLQLRFRGTTANSYRSDMAIDNLRLAGNGNTGNAPTAQFTANRVNIEVGENVTFTDQSTGNPTSRSWSFNGGSPNSSTSARPVITYNTAGQYQVSLTVSNALGTDTETKNAYITVTNPSGSCNKIACFTSISPTSQTSRLIIPSSHRFQMLMQQGENYTTGGGRVPGNNDFTGYVPISNSSTSGYLSVNHENTPGGVSMMRIGYSTSSKLWNVSSNQAVDFYNNDLVTTTRNCSGGVTPWGTIITCEETYNSGDDNRDGYEDVGWCVEVDAATKRVRSYGNGRQEKLWALGRMRHENVVVASDRKTVYFGEDGGTSCVYKFVANTAENLSSGRLYVLRLDGSLSGGNPSRSTGRWIQVPNSTRSDRNNTSSLGSSLGGNNFSGVEDVEIHPASGQVYYTSKGFGRVYRFTDNGSTVSGFQVYVGGRSYPITTNSGTTNTSWGSGNDNLAFDNDGNLWVLQDGGNDYIWLVENGHSQSNPKVKLFGSTPRGSEPTGITFSPDNRFMFLSIQHPSSSNSSQTDAAGNSVRFNRSSTIVIARNENLGTFTSRTTSTSIAEKIRHEEGLKIYPNPPRDGKINLSFVTEYEGEVMVELLNTQGQKIATLTRTHLEAGTHQLSFDLNKYVRSSQNLFIAITNNGKRQVKTIRFQK